MTLGYSEATDMDDRPARRVEHQDPADPSAPTRPPRTDARCWPFPCRDWHRTAVHLDGSEPCECGCHIYGRDPSDRDDR